MVCRVQPLVAHENYLGPQGQLSKWLAAPALKPSMAP